MAWIESHQSLAHHPKTLRLATALRCTVPCAIGYVHLLWYWALDYAPEGKIATDMRDQVALACHWRGKAETFWMGMLHAGFIESTEDGIRVHDWMDYAGRLADKRAANAQRMRDKRSAHVQRTVQRTSDEPFTARAGATNKQTGEGIKPSPSQTPPNPQIDVDAQGGSAPRVDSPDPAIIHADAGTCPLCRQTYLGSYLDHTAAKHKVNSSAEPGNLHFSRRFRSEPEAPPPEFEAQLAAGHERLEHLDHDNGR